MPTGWMPRAVAPSATSSARHWGSVKEDRPLLGLVGNFSWEEGMQEKEKALLFKTERVTEIRRMIKVRFRDNTKTTSDNIHRTGFRSLINGPEIVKKIMNWIMGSLRAVESQGRP